ncbi:MAG: AAA family ATPase [Nitrososphaerales archaeon]
MKKIETRGFKSMGAKVITAPVERGFVAITGPNGSGKSNLLDAILFALGENSAKTLRVPNLSGLIYDGSVEEQKPSSAKVSLQFDNSDRRIPVDSDSVTLSRELKSNGESIYSFNGKHIQRNNLSDLLENALIASRGLNVVLQGMITRISELVPDEKRRLIEQMVGIAQFDEKKNLALAQLKEADVKLEVAMAKIGEIRDRVQLLEQQRNDQLKLRQLEQEISWLRAAASSTKLVAVRRTLAQRREAHTGYGAKLQELQDRLGAILKSIEELDAERSFVIKSAVDSGTAQIEAELGRVNNELNALKKERQEATNYIERMKEVVPALSKIIEDNTQKIAGTEAHVLSLSGKIKQCELHKESILQEQKALSELRASFEADFNAAQAKIGSVRKDKHDADSRLGALRLEHNNLLSQVKSTEERLVSIQEKIKFYVESSSEAEKSISEIEAILQAQREELGQIEETKEKIEKLRKKVEQQLDIAAIILEKTQGAVIKYDSDLAAMESVAGEEIALARLESLGGSSAISGYLGPLRSLVSFDQEYAQAIAAIGRDWLNAVVVEDLDCLIKTTEAAKKLKISRLTTIPLKEVGDFKEPSVPSSLQGVIARVSSVVHADRKLKQVVNFVFGDALIIDSPRNAFVAARRGFRAVTLQGDVFEPELLAFETGYSKKYAKMTDLLAKQESFEGIKKVLGAFRGVIEKRKASLAKLEQRKGGAFKEEQEKTLNISKIEAKLESSRQYLKRYYEYSEQLKAKQEETRIELLKLEGLVKEKETRVADQEIVCNELEARLATMDLGAFNERLTELGKKEHDINSRIDATVAEIRDLTTEQIRTKVELENGLRPSREKTQQQLVEVQKTIESKSNFLEETQGKLSELEAEYTRLHEDEQKSLEKTNKFQPMLDALDQKLKSLKSEEDTTRRAISSTDRELMTTSLDINRMQDSERQLLGELAIYGYAEPVESFDGAESLMKELNTEYDLLRNNVNLLADKNYREIFENYKYSSVRKNDLEKERNAIVTFIETIDAEKRRVFMDAFERIDRELRIIFNKITNGSGWLEIENPDAIFDSGVFLMAQFPGKLPRDSSSVSGGEKTISALSFILAIQAVFPSPFYVFDEVDAHLDSNYSGKLAEILAERSDRSQIIIVSLKDVVVSKAQSVIGVYMSQGSSKVIRYKSPMEVEIPNEQ